MLSKAKRIMKSERMTEQIITEIKAYIKPNVVSGLMNDLRRSETMERRMIKENRSGNKRRGRVSLGDQDKLDRLITFCQAQLSSDEVCQAMLGIGDIFKLHGETTRAEEMYSWDLGKAEESGEKGFIAEACLRRGEIYSRRGQWKLSTSDLDRSCGIFSDLRRCEGLGRAENIMGTNYAEQGKVKQAVKYFESALGQFERTREMEMTGVVQMNLGIVNNIIGEYDTALAHYMRARSSFEGTGEQHRLAELHHNMGMSYLFKERYHDAIKYFNASHLLSARNGNTALMGLASLGKANAYYRLRDLPVALQLVTQAVELFTRSADRPGIADAYKVKGMIHREMKNYETAESYLRTSLRINSEIGNPLNVGESYFEIGVLEAGLRKKEEALQAFQMAKAAFRKIGAQKEMKKSDDQIASLGGRKR